MEVGPGEKMLNLEKVNDIRTWISAAMTDQDTCIDGLEEMGSKFLDEIKAKIERSKEFLSISLAIIAKMQALLENFDLKMH
jgi:pectinesterase inhibitor-like protein